MKEHNGHNWPNQWRQIQCDMHAHAILNKCVALLWRERENGSRKQCVICFTVINMNQGFSYLLPKSITYCVHFTFHTQSPCQTATQHTSLWPGKKNAFLWLLQGPNHNQQWLNWPEIYNFSPHHFKGASWWPIYAFRPCLPHMWYKSQ